MPRYFEARNVNHRWSRKRYIWYVIVIEIHNAYSTSNILHLPNHSEATRHISKGEIVAPAPLVHIPYKDAVSYFGEMKDENDMNILTPEGFTMRDTDVITGKQLLLNYCFGHSKSTLLLCPYGSGTT